MKNWVIAAFIVMVGVSVSAETSGVTEFEFPSLEEDQENFRIPREFWAVDSLIEHAEPTDDNSLFNPAAEKVDPNLIRAKFLVNYSPKYDFEPTPVRFGVQGFMDGISWGRRGLNQFLASTLGHNKNTYREIMAPQLLELMKRLIVSEHYKARQQADGALFIYRRDGLGARKCGRSGTSRCGTKIAEIAMDQRVDSNQELNDLLWCAVDDGEEKTREEKLERCPRHLVKPSIISAISYPLPLLARKITELSYCFGLDPIVFTGMLFRETRFRGADITRHGTGFTQMIGIAIVEVDHQIKPEVYYNHGKVLRNEVTGLYSGGDPLQKTAHWENISCYNPEWENHSYEIKQEDVAKLKSKSPTQISQSSYVYKIKNWLVYGYVKRTEEPVEIDPLVLLDRQLIYGAIHKKTYAAKHLFKNRRQQPIRTHYWNVGYKYNNNPNSRVSYANDLVRDFPQLIGLEIPQEAQYLCSTIYPRRDGMIVDPAQYGIECADDTSI